MKFEIPDRMKHLKLDARGFPIPCMVYIDSDGRPHFAINDDKKRFRVINNDLCSICGTKLFRGRWFVGGALSAFHPEGAFIDPPMHSECCHFALKICPYLAAPRYSGEIGVLKAKSHAVAIKDDLIIVDPTMMPGRPGGDMFIALMTTGAVDLCQNLNMRPRKPFSVIEYWRHGERLPDLQGEQMVREALENFDPAILEQNNAHERLAG